MRRRTLAIIVAAAVIVAVLIIGVVRASAQGSSKLPSITVAQLLQNVATKAHGTTAVSGEFAWTNDLLGTNNLLSLGSQTPSGLSSLLQGGSGRVWLQNGKARIESQGQGGDFVAVVNGMTAWTWDSMTNTATQYALPAPPAGATATPSPSPSIDPATAIANLVAKLAPTATMSVSGQTVVGNQHAYVLKLTPVSSVTTFGSIQVAIDGRHWVPLQLQVFAKGGTKAVLSAGFKSVSYAPVSASLFSFTPPSGAKVVHKDLSKATQGLMQGKTAPTGATHKPLTLAQATAQAPFLLTPSSTPTGLSFEGAFVTPATTGKTTTGTTATHPPVAVLHYGMGFGSVIVVETPASAKQDQQIQKQLGSSARSARRP